MDSARIAALLVPFLPAPLAAPQLADISTYIDLLLRWNRRLALTAVRDPEPIATRHIGESLFAAAHLLPASAATRVLDVGSGAGFPGLPLKLYAPAVHLTLLEAHGKKATFLREVVRTLRLRNVDVLAARAEDTAARGELVTLRAVEHFEEVVPLAATLLDRAAPSPRLALLIGAAQVEKARARLPGFRWDPPILIPQSAARVLLVGSPQ